MEEPKLDADQKLEVLRFLRNVTVPVIGVIALLSGVVGFSVSQSLRNTHLETTLAEAETKLLSVRDITESRTQAKIAEESALRSAAAADIARKQVETRDAEIARIVEAAREADPRKLADALSELPGFRDAVSGRLAGEMVGKLRPSVKKCDERERVCYCDQGWAVAGGADGPGDSGLVIRASRPTDDARGWVIECSSRGQSDNVPCASTYAVCLSLGSDRDTHT